MKEHRLNTGRPAFPLRCGLCYDSGPVPGESRLKLLFAVTATLCFLLRWSHFVLGITALFQTTDDSQGLTPAPWQDTCCANAVVPGLCVWLLSSLRSLSPQHPVAEFSVSEKQIHLFIFFQKAAQPQTNKSR